MLGVALKRSGNARFDWQLAASRYDYPRDEVRAWAPTIGSNAGAAFNPLAGRLTDQGGTGWQHLSARGAWKAIPDHLVEFGLQADEARLLQRVSPISEWTAGTPAVAPTSRFEGDTRTLTAWLQMERRFAPDWKLVTGLRAERWQAERGLTANGAATFLHPKRQQGEWSPKLALGWQFSEEGQLRISTGRALRFPTVSELFQGGVSASTGALSNGDPNLRPEDSQTTDLSADWRFANGFGTYALRATLFHEATQDALYSQTNTTVTPNITNVQNVDRIRTWGVELAAQGRDVLLPGLDLSASLTFADSVITANAKFPASVGKWQPRVPRWRASATASLRFDPQWTSSLGLRYSGKQFNTLDNSDPNGARYQGVSDFLVLDARLRYRWSAPWSAALGVDNLNNARYWNFHPYPTRTASAELRFSL